jgi:hypothetical protein
MIIDNPDVIGIAVPPENNPVLVIDADGPVPGQIALQLLKSVRGGDAQVIQAGGDFQPQQFSMGRSNYIGRKSFDMLIIENGFRLRATE